MVFASPIFILLFLPIVLAGSVVFRKGLTNIFLLLASLIFYAWGDVRHVPLLIVLIVFNWFAGIAIERHLESPARRFILAATIAVDVGALVVFKYLNFIVENVNDLAGVLHLSSIPATHIVLPLGISFFTFHLLSYVIDIHRGAAKAQRNPLNFALYISFFPQMIAGPIIRYHDVERQLTDRRVTLDRFASGVERFVVGLGKKVLIANAFGPAADKVFSLPSQDLTCAAAWLGLVCYAIQLYYDFSGYSDMAIGLGRMFGFEYLENFNYPFISTSISEFWRRWHISLSNWFRDYLYLPLVLATVRRSAANARGRPKKVDDRLQLAIVFLICGAWHGANWTFVIWGLIHGVFLALERGAFGNMIKRLPRPLAHLYVLCVIMLAWVFFRAESVTQAIAFLAAMVGLGADGSQFSIAEAVDRRIVILFPLALLCLTPALSPITQDWRARALQAFGQLAPVGDRITIQGPIDRAMAIVRPPLLAAILMLSVAYIAGQTYNPFIYFRF